MRIVGGQWRGRAIAAPKGSTTRPTTDRVREALFSAIAARLGGDLGGADVLDAFAGSGALGLEALSRGAASVTFVERDRAALSALNANIASLGAQSKVRVLTGEVFALAGRGMRGPFSLIMLDPPYTLDAAVVAGLLGLLAGSGALAPGALVTWEHAEARPVEWPEGFEPEASKRYGSTRIDFGTYERGALT